MSDQEKINLINAYGGILPYYEALYLSFLREHIGRSLDCFYWFYTLAIRKREKEALMVFSEAIRQAAIVGRYFKSIRKKPQHTMRAERLREAFKVSTDNPLLVFEFRNFFEHMDEKLDDYLLSGISGTILPFCLTDEDFTEEDFKVGHVFIGANPRTGTAWALNNSFKFNEILAELNRLFPIVINAEENGGRLPK